MSETQLRSPLGDPFDAAAFFRFARQVGHTRALDMDFASAGERWAELKLPWREGLVGVPAAGIVASGAIVSLIDTASGMAVWIARGSFTPLATIDLRIDYLQPARKGETVYARCDCVRLTRKIAFTRGTAHVGNIEEPIAYSSGTFMLGG